MPQPITFSSPIHIDGADYPYTLINLAISPLLKGIPITGIGASVALKLTPFRITEQGIDINYDNPKPLIFPDAFESAINDPDLGVCVQAINDAIQAYLLAKGV